MSDKPSITLRTAAITDIGRVRRQNEDRFLRRDDVGFYAVADGIGGLPGGAAAAQACIEALDEQTPAVAEVNESSDLIPLIHAANRRVVKLAQRVSPQLGMGTTLICTVVRGDQLHLAHVGDSRCYLIRDGATQLLTTDHSLANDLARSGASTPAGYDDYQLGALTRCIGQPDDPEIDVAEQTLRPGDLVLLASDGISRVIPDAELPELLGGEAALAERLAGLIELVHERGAPDNATAVLLVVD